MRCLVGFIFLLSAADWPGLRIGAPPPPFHVDAWLQGAGARDWEGLRGRAAVAEIWGTWCSPCVAHIPAWNRLADEFADQPIAFLSVAYDDRSRLSEFLKDRPKKGWIGCDADGKTYQNFGIPGVGYWALIGKDGVVKRIADAEKITPETLAKLIAGEDLNLPALVTEADNLAWDRELIDWKDGVPPIAQVIIKPIATRTGGMMHKAGRNRMSADGAALPPLIRWAYDIEAEQLDYRLPPNELTYRVSAMTPPDCEAQLRPLFRETLKATFGFQERWQEREKDVCVSRRIPGRQPAWGADGSAGTSMTSGRRMMAKNASEATLRSHLGMVLSNHVVDETGLTGNADWDIEVRRDKPEFTVAQVREKLGLDVAPARRRLKVLVIKP